MPFKPLVSNVNLLSNVNLHPYTAAPKAEPPASAPAAAPPAAAAPKPAPAGGARKVTCLHFNDVYNLEEGKKEPVGGAARFAGMLGLQTDDPIVLFSGDALNPSMASTFFKVCAAALFIDTRTVLHLQHFPDLTFPTSYTAISDRKFTFYVSRDLTRQPMGLLAFHGARDAGTALNLLYAT